MPDQNPNCPEPAVYFLTRIGSDARNAAEVLGKAAIHLVHCAEVRELCARADDQAGALIISEDSLDRPAIASLLDFLVHQPPWSDIPIVLLTATGEIQTKAFKLLDYLGAHANVTLLEKPLRAFTLVSVVNAALRARARQYEIRGLLENYARSIQDAQTAIAKFRAVFDQSAVFAGIMTLEGIFTEANRLCLEVCGYRAEEVLGRPFWECGWWRGSREVQEKLRAGTVQASQGAPFKETLPYLWADGTKRVVEFALHPIRDEAGKVIFLHPTGMDITERNAASARAEFLSQLTQKLSVVSDPEEINRIATREIGQFLGAHRCYFSEPLANPNEIRILPDWRCDDQPDIGGTYWLPDFGSRQLWTTIGARAFAVDDVGKHEWTRTFLPRYQTVKIMAFNQAPFIHDGRCVASVAVSSDQPRHWTVDEQSLLENAVARVWPLIERSRAEAALRQANALLADKASHLETLVQQRTAKLQETIGELESFSYSIAHDMRAPLRSLRGFADMLLEDYAAKLDENGREYLHRIANSSDRMDKLILDVLHYSRVVRTELILEPVDLEQLLRGIIDSYPILAPDNAEVALNGPFPPVLGNEAMLTQIFSNLMGNAVKFVQDNGIGIPVDQHDRIFGIFQRVNKNFEGTGIGLAIVKKAAERMGGNVGVESEPDQGSTFWVDVQLA